MATGRWFSPLSYTNAINRHDIAEQSLKVVLNTITPTFTLTLLIPA
jgi:hypothetical protein